MAWIRPTLVAAGPFCRQEDGADLPQATAGSEADWKWGRRN
jgi:hypothetical protein